MSDITRDDLYVADGSLWDAEVHQVTDEEFDRLAREAGYTKLGVHIDPLLTSERYDVMDWLRDIRGPDRAKALRVLLTDECDECGGDGLCRHPECDGHGNWRYQDIDGKWHEDQCPRCSSAGCPRCGGRGWLPKDGVSEGWQWTTEGKREPSGDLIIPLDWLEAEDEQ